MNKPVTKKALLLSLIVSLVLIIAGAAVFAFAGFNPDSTMRDASVIEVSDVMRLSDEEREALEDFCTERIEAQYSVSKVEYGEESATGGSILRYTLAGGETATAEFADSLEEAIVSGNVAGVSGGLVTVSVHTTANAPYTMYIWRTAIGAGAVLVLLFIYGCIRFKVGPGITMLISTVRDLALTLALAALLRIPAGVGLIGVAVFALFFSALLNLLVFGKMRKDFASDEYKGIPAREAVAKSVADGSKTVLLIAVLAAALCVLLGIVGIFIGTDLLWSMLIALIAVAACVTSALFLSPAIYAGIKEKSDAVRANKARYNYTPEKKSKQEAAPVQESAEN